MFLLQNTKDLCDFELLVTVHGGDDSDGRGPGEAALKKLKESASYLKWSAAVQPWLQAPRRSKRFLNLATNSVK